MEKTTITAYFKPGQTFLKVRGVSQWDHGVQLKIAGLGLEAGTQVLFSLTENTGEATTRVSSVTDGDATVTIPQDLLSNNSTEVEFDSFPLWAFVCVTDANATRTVAKIKIIVDTRPKNGEDTTDAGSAWDDIVAQVSQYASQAASYATAAQGQADAASFSADAADAAATLAGTHASAAEASKSNAQQAAQSAQEALETIDIQVVEEITTGDIDALGL